MKMYISDGLLICENKPAKQYPYLAIHEYYNCFGSPI